jgi:hypothetical protein
MWVTLAIDGADAFGSFVLGGREYTGHTILPQLVSPEAGDPDLLASAMMYAIEDQLDEDAPAIELYTRQIVTELLEECFVEYRTQLATPDQLQPASVPTRGRRRLTR